MLRSTFAKASQAIAPSTRRLMMTSSQAKPASKKEGDISDSFASLSGGEAVPLPDRFRQLKLDLVRGHEQKVVDSWTRLLRELRKENAIIAEKRSAVIPQVEYADFESGIDKLKDEIRKRGAVVVKGVIPEAEARAYKDEVIDYVKKNPSTRAFPAHDPQVYELYWSGPQLKARSHPSVLHVQQHLMSFLWHTTPSSQISLTNPLSYADRLRIRQPGDATFALGPHMDGGSVERWEKNGYGAGGVYDAIFAGEWESFDPWDASGRVDAVNNLYDGLGACTMFRMWQGWLSMSRSGPKEGTLLVNPLMRLATVYLLLRPFFKPVADLKAKNGNTAEFLHEDNWAFAGEEGMTSELQGATMGRGQEFTEELHPHLELEKTMVHMPDIRPGDFVAWHCDTIHSVDKIHAGKSDSSVLYIPVCPVTSINAEYLARQREAFRNGTPGPDFPGGEGEARHVERPTEEMLSGWTNDVGRKAMGLERLDVTEGALPGQKEVVERANAILGF